MTHGCSVNPDPTISRARIAWWRPSRLAAFACDGHAHAPPMVAGAIARARCSRGAQDNPFGRCQARAIVGSGLKSGRPGIRRYLPSTVLINQFFLFNREL